MIPALCNGCKFKCESPDQYWGMLEGCANREIELLQAEIKACYRELMKISCLHITAPLDESGVYSRVRKAWLEGKLDDKTDEAQS